MCLNIIVKRKSFLLKKLKDNLFKNNNNNKNKNNQMNKKVKRI